MNTELTDEQWALIQPMLPSPNKWHMIGAHDFQYPTEIRTVVYATNLRVWASFSDTFTPMF